jgi:hypothetical protein
MDQLKQVIASKQNNFIQKRQKNQNGNFYSSKIEFKNDKKTNMATFSRQKFN